MNRRPPKTGSRLEDPPAHQNGSLTVRDVNWTTASLLLDGCSVYCLQSGSHIVLFLQRLKIFFLPPRCRTIFSVGCREFTTDGGGLHEVSGRQAFRRRRWSKDERQPRRCILERTEGDRRRARHDVV